MSPTPSPDSGVRRPGARLRDRLTALRAAGRFAVVPFVVLGDPDDLEAAGIGDLHQFQILAGDFGHVLARREARHVDGNGEFHGCGPFAIGLDRASSKHGACGAAR